MEKKVTLDLEVLEARIAPSSTGYEGQPGHQSSGGSNNPVPNGSTPQPKG